MEDAEDLRPALAAAAEACHEAEIAPHRLDSGVVAFQALRKALIKVGRDPKPAVELLAVLSSDKLQLLTLLADLHDARRIYRRQISEVAAILLQSEAWRAADNASGERLVAVAGEMGALAFEFEKSDGSTPQATKNLSLHRSGVSMEVLLALSLCQLFLVNSNSSSSAAQPGGRACRKPGCKDTVPKSCISGYCSEHCILENCTAHAREECRFIAAGSLQLLTVGEPSEKIQLGSTAPRGILAIAANEEQEVLGTSTQDWCYPVLTGTKLCLALEDKSMLFPVLLDDGFYGLKTSSSADLEALAQELAKLGCIIQRTGTTQAAQALERGGLAVARAVRSGGYAAGRGIEAAAGAAKQAIQPAKQSVVVPDAVKRGVIGARCGTRKLAVVTHDLVDGLSNAAIFMGRKAASAAKATASAGGVDADKVGKKVGDSGAGKSGKVVGKSGLKAVGEVYGALKEAVGVVAVGVADKSSEVVEHKYGEEAGIVTRDGFHTAGNLCHLKGPVGVVKAAAVGAVVKVAKPKDKDGKAEDDDHHGLKGVPLTKVGELGLHGAQFAALI